MAPESMAIRIWLALAVSCAWAAWGAGPSYSAEGIVNAPNYTPGPFAPNSVISVYGKGLARSTQSFTLVGGRIPVELNYVRVYVQDQPVPLLYVSDGQINFIMSSTENTGPVRIRVVTEGITGPEITVTLVDAAPALFPNPIAAGYVIAQDAKGNLLTADAPAHAHDIVVVYATGLGQTAPNTAVGEIPSYAAPILPSTVLTVKLNGKALDPELIKYAGVTPASAGLYQINIYLPEGTGDDPEIQVSAGSLTAQTGLKLPVR